VFDLVRYRYTNGRPSYIEFAYGLASDLSAYAGYDLRYLQYNWHGDAVIYVDRDGAGGEVTRYDPWGNWPPATPTRWNYYRWNGAWGYLRFDDLGLYYIHGRWYNPDTGMFISPDANGSYIYYDNDPINKHADAPPPRHNLPSECLPGLTNYDPRDLTCWLFREMKTNLNDPRLQAVKQTNMAGNVGLVVGSSAIAGGVLIANPLVIGAGGFVDVVSAGAYALAGYQFYNLVADQQPWNFKHKIRTNLGPGITLCHSGGCWNKVEYSVPGNIHYGFVGREAGYFGQIIHAGAAWAEFNDPSHDPKKARQKGVPYAPYEGAVGCTSGSWCFGPFGWSLNLGDEAKDHQAVQFGIYLYDKFAAGRGLTFSAFQLELSRALVSFARHDPDPLSVRPDIAQYWPYPLKYFNAR